MFDLNFPIQCYNPAKIVFDKKPPRELSHDLYDGDN